MTQVLETPKDDLRRTEQSCVEMFLIRASRESGVQFLGVLPY